MFGLLLAAAVSAVYAVSPPSSSGRAAQSDLDGARTPRGFVNSAVRSLAVSPLYSPPPAPALPRPNELVSINRSGTDSANHFSFAQDMTPDGRYVVFLSYARDLVPEIDGNENNSADVFLRDMQTGKTELISINRAGTASGNGNGYLFSPTISDDGRYVAFTSDSTDLVVNDTNRDYDVFLRDRQTGTTELISVNRAGTASGNGISVYSAISPDGRYVVFSSTATDLVPENDTNIMAPEVDQWTFDGSDVFLRDRQTGTTRLVSINSAGTASGSRVSSHAKITPDGRYVAFVSSAPDLVADVNDVNNGINVNDVNNGIDVFVRDMQTATTALVSVNSAGTGSGNAESGVDFNITSDGRYVVFASSAGDLAAAPVDANRKGDVYVRDLQAKKTTLVSINRAGTASGNAQSYGAEITPDGRYITYASLAGDLIENDANNGEDVFVRDMQMGATEIISVNRAGMASASNYTGAKFTYPADPLITADGRYVAFASSATDLTDEYDDGYPLAYDIFVRDRQRGVTTLVTVSNAGGSSGNHRSVLKQITDDGRYVLFDSNADNLAARDTNRVPDVFRHDTAARSGILQFSTDAFGVDESAGVATITVMRAGGTAGAVNVNYATSDGTGTAGADYTAASGTLSFAAGETTKTFSVAIIDDEAVEGNEVLKLRLTDPAGGAALGSPANAVLTILENDSCSYSINSSNRTSPAAGETLIVNVTAQSGCVWTAVSNNSFINVANGAAGSGSGEVTLVIAANNSGAARAGTVTIAGRTFTVTQSELVPEVGLIYFDQGGFNADEGAGRATIHVGRRGNLAGTATVEYLTSDDPAAVPCDPSIKRADGTPYPLGIAFARCDYATTIDTVTFAPGETVKEIYIPLVDDAHVEGGESVEVRLRNATGATLVSGQSSGVLTISDNDTAGGTNPIFNTAFFVRQHYLDFLSREPEANEPWSGVLSRCPNVNNDPACDRTLVSQSFFGSPEFRLKGFFVYNFYRVAFGRMPEYHEIIPDLRGVSGDTAREVYARRAALPLNFTQRQEFKTAYDALNDRQYVDALLHRYSIQSINTADPVDPEGGTKVLLTRADMVNRMSATGMQALTRAQVFRAIAESDEVAAAEFNGAFVAMQYYGYLRRTPEETGFQAWLRVINQDPNNIRIMVNGFMNSTEYRLRFGQP
jgi:Tol biopolymer transport system component